MSVRDTSLAAFESIKPRAQNLRSRIYDTLMANGPSTTDEMAEVLGETVLSVRPQFTVLQQEERIVATAYRRTNESGRKAIVWAPL